jgi:hypothetical protein
VPNEEYSILPVRMPSACKSPPSHEVVCHIDGQESWREALSLDMVVLAALDMQHKADRVLSVSDAEEMRRTVLVGELYYQNFCDGPNRVPSRNLNRRQIKKMNNNIAAIAAEILGEETVEEIQAHAAQKYWDFIEPLPPLQEKSCLKITHWLP